MSEAEREYLLGYYALVRAGKTNYVATTAMLAFFGHRGQEPTEFFKTYSVRAPLLSLYLHLPFFCLILTSGSLYVQAEFKPKKRRTTKNGGTGSAQKSVPTRASGRGKGEAASAKDAADEEDVEM